MLKKLGALVYRFLRTKAVGWCESAGVMAGSQRHGGAQVAGSVTEVGSTPSAVRLGSRAICEGGSLWIYNPTPRQSVKRERSMLTIGLHISMQLGATLTLT